MRRRAVNFSKAAFARRIEEIVGADTVKPDALVYVLRCVDGIVKVGVTCHLVRRVAGVRWWPHKILEVIWFRRYRADDARNIEERVRVLSANQRHLNLCEYATDYYRQPASEAIPAVLSAEASCAVTQIARYQFEPIPPPWDAIRRFDGRHARNGNAGVVLLESEGVAFKAEQQPSKAPSK
jgi:hypothetical protein